MKGFILKSACIIFIVLSTCTLHAANRNDILINEIAWMGTNGSSSDEWIELLNTSDIAISLTNWTLIAVDGTPHINLSGTIAAGGLFLLERTDDSSVPGIKANLIYTGAMNNSGEVLELRDASGLLIDQVDGWTNGNSKTKATMERISSGWTTATARYKSGIGTPKSKNTSNKTLH